MRSSRLFLIECRVRTISLLSNSSFFNFLAINNDPPPEILRCNNVQ